MRPDGPGLERTWDAPHHHTSLDDALEYERFHNQEHLRAASFRETPPSWQQRIAHALNQIVLHFPPSWFTVIMGTGITSVLLYNFPYQAKWLQYIAYIVFVLSLVLFVLFCIISVIRYARWPILFRFLLRHTTHSMFLGAFSLAFITVVNAAIVTILPSWGYSFALFIWAMWWIASITCVFMSISITVVQFTRHEHTLATVTGVMIIPVIGPIVASGAGANMASMLPSAHARLTLVLSYIMWGIGFVLVMMTFAMFYQRLTIHKIPPAAMVVTIFLPLGPMGQASFALLKLSSVLLDICRQSGAAFVGISELSPDEARIMALGLYGASIASGLVLWGFALAWAIIAICLIVDLWMVSELAFNIGWWGFVFPVGQFCLATSQLAKEFNSAAFRVLGSIFTVIEILLWLVMLSITTYRAVRGDLFVSPGLLEAEGMPPKKGQILGRVYNYEPRAHPAENGPATDAPETSNTNQSSANGGQGHANGSTEQEDWNSESTAEEPQNASRREAREGEGISSS